MGQVPLPVRWCYGPEPYVHALDDIWAREGVWAAALFHVNCQASTHGLVRATWRAQVASAYVKLHAILVGLMHSSLMACWVSKCSPPHRSMHAPLCLQTGKSFTLLELVPAVVSEVLRGLAGCALRSMTVLLLRGDDLDREASAHAAQMASACNAVLMECACQSIIGG